MIPLLIGGAVLYGGKKIIDANDKLDLAKKINEEAKQLVETSKSTAEEAVDNTNGAIAFLKEEISSSKDIMNDFVNNIKQIKNIRFEGMNDSTEYVDSFKIDLQNFFNVQTSFDVSDIVISGGVGLAAGSAVTAVLGRDCGSCVGYRRFYVGRSS